MRYGKILASVTVLSRFQERYNMRQDSESTCLKHLLVLTHQSFSYIDHTIIIYWMFLRCLKDILSTSCHL